jgi:hypothetical protein
MGPLTYTPETLAERLANLIRDQAAGVHYVSYDEHNQLLVVDGTLDLLPLAKALLAGDTHHLTFTTKEKYLGPGNTETHVCEFEWRDVKEVEALKGERIFLDGQWVRVLRVATYSMTGQIKVAGFVVERHTRENVG